MTFPVVDVDLSQPPDDQFQFSLVERTQQVLGNEFVETLKKFPSFARILFSSHYGLKFYLETADTDI